MAALPGVPAYRYLNLCDRVLDLLIVADVCVDPRMACRARCVTELVTVREYLVQRRERLSITAAFVFATCVANSLTSSAPLTESLPCLSVRRDFGAGSTPEPPRPDSTSSSIECSSASIEYSPSFVVPAVSTISGALCFATSTTPPPG